MNDFVDTLETEFVINTDEKIALKQKAYMRNKFEFYGITAVKRREIQKPFLVKSYLPDKKEVENIVKILWEKPQREFQMFSLDFTLKYVKQFEKSDIKLLEFMVLNKSWWDTVDMIAAKLMGEYFKLYSEEKLYYVNKWLSSDNMWLQRCAILFQLKYKQDIDTQLLDSTINSLLGSKEFFINKAIGWILREYSKTNPEWVIEYVNKAHLSGLSRREALRLIK